MHWVWLALDVKPGGQGEQLALPGTAATKPSGQVLQAGDPKPEANVPAAQGTQNALPGSE
jgi:hypothetical protein